MGKRKETIKAEVVQIHDKLEALQYALALLVTAKEFTLTARSEDNELEIVVFSEPNQEIKVLKECLTTQFKLYEELKSKETHD